jgi:peptidoglycan/xylan/chitin deacetylase (PgdA/CDA1 family)/sulfur carrier protein ThiS
MSGADLGELLDTPPPHGDLRVRRGHRVHPKRKAPWRRFAVLASVLAIVIVAVAGAWAAAGPIAVRVNDKTLRVARGTTVARLLARRDQQGLRGDLVAVDGNVLEEGKGAGPKALIEGREVPPTRALAGGDRVTITPGADTTEPATRKERSFEASPTYDGSGPYEFIRLPGKPGLEVVLRGKVSNRVVRLVEKPAVPAVIRRATWFTSPPPLIEGDHVALTFDDGPNPPYTGQILDILKEADVKATFFMLGTAVARHPDLAARIAQEGHTVANHSYYHLNWNTISVAQLEDEMAWTSAAILKATGKSPLWLRPPGGRTNSRVYRTAREQNLALVLWDGDTNDWKKPPPATITYSALSGIRPGGTILMHDGGGDRSNTVAALPGVIAGIKKRGYSCVTLDQLFGAGPLPN